MRIQSTDNSRAGTTPVVTTSQQEKQGDVGSVRPINERRAEHYLNWLDPEAEEFVFQTFSDNARTKVTAWEETVPLAKQMAAHNDARPVPSKKKQVTRDPLAATRVGTYEDLKPWLKEQNDKGAGVFATINETRDGSRKATDLVKIRAVWADLDHGIPEAWPLQPSFVVESSPGKQQAYWQVDGDMTREQFHGVMGCLVDNYGADTNAKDVVRVLRVPGYWHLKSDPFQVRFHGGITTHYEPPRYTAAQLMKAFPAPARQQRSCTNGEYAGAVDDTMTAERVSSALEYLADMPTDSGELYVDCRESWIKFGIALKREFGDAGFEIWDAWSRKSPKYDEYDMHYRWQTLDVSGDDGKGVTIGTIFHHAKLHGWKPAPVNVLATIAPELEAETATETHTITDTVAHKDETDDKLTAVEWGIKQTQAKGGERQWAPEALKEMLQRMNKEHAVVPIGGKVRYLHRSKDRNGKMAQTFLAPEDMKRLYAAVIVNGARETAFDAWNRWPGRKQYKGVGFFPGSPKNKPVVPVGFLNLWTGFAVDPMPGDCLLLKKHLLEVVCGGNVDLYDWVIDWLAQCVQEPQVKPGTAVVLRSAEKGSGKSMIVEVMKDIFGEHGQSASQADHITGKFNAHLEQTVFLGIEEGFYAGDKQSKGTLKTLITQPTISIERKGLDLYKAPNYTHLMFTSNEAWVVPVDGEERRFCVIEFRNEHANKRSYFDPIFKQLNNGGREAFLHELLERKIESDLRQPPTTDGLLAQRIQSMDGPRRFLFDLAINGELADPDERERSIVLRDDEDTPILGRAVVQAARISCSGFELRGLQTSLGPLLKNAGVKKLRSTKEKQRGYQYVFPKLSEFRTGVSVVLGLPPSTWNEAD